MRIGICEEVGCDDPISRVEAMEGVSNGDKCCADYGSLDVPSSTLHCTASPLRSFAYARSSCKKVYACEGEKAVGKSVWQSRARVYGSRELAVQV